jgi:anti-anti-sigma factor
VTMKRSTGTAVAAPARGSATYIEGGLVALHGAVESTCTAELRDELVRFSQGGTRSLVIDVTDVSFLDSSGVRLLYEVMAWADDGRKMRIVATSGCPAERVLRTAGLLDPGVPPHG